MNEKTTGYLLLALGLIIILLSALNIYLIFTGQSRPAHIFNLSGINLDLSTLGLGLPTKAGSTQVISANELNDSVNFFAHIFVVGFFVNVGFKIAQLGIELLRPVVVKLREEKP